MMMCVLSFAKTLLTYNRSLEDEEIILLVLKSMIIFHINLSVCLLSCVMELWHFTCGAYVGTTFSLLKYNISPPRRKPVSTQF